MATKVEALTEQNTLLLQGTEELKQKVITLTHQLEQQAQAQVAKRAPAKKGIGDTYNGEEVIGFAKVGASLQVPSGKGFMVNMNGIDGAPNLRGFVSNALAMRLKTTQNYPVTKRVAKSSGKEGYACYLIGNKAVYGQKKEQ